MNEPKPNWETFAEADAALRDNERLRARVAELETNAIRDKATIERARHELGQLRATQCDCGMKYGNGLEAKRED